MGQFQYRAADAAGKVVEGTMDAAEAATVVARLQDRGLVPIRIAVAGERKGGARPARLAAPVLRRRAGSAELLVLTQELAALVGAGLPLDRSLATLCELADHPEVKAAVGEVLTQVRGGKGLAESLGQHRMFPPLYVNMVRAGEVGGFLEQALTRLAEYLERSEELRSDVIGALIYPAFLMVSLGGSMLFLLIYVLPKFADLFEGVGALPLPARIVMGVSEVIRSYWWLLPVLVALGWFGQRRYLATAGGRLQWDSLKLRLPGLGAVLRKLEVARFCRTLGTLIRSGVPMIQALVIAREVAGNVVLARAVGAVEVGVREGAGVSGPLARSGVAPALAVQMISVGEETGRLDEMLLRVAEHYDREVRAQIQRFTRLLEPVLIVVMALLVGFVVISMLNAVFSLNDLPM